MTFEFAGTKTRAAACAVLLACAAPRFAHAQFVHLLDSSARAGGMGGAAVAVNGAGTRDLWMNPALAATAPGFFVQSSTQQLVPGLATDLQMRATRLGVSFAGIALTSAGRPFGGSTLVQPTTSALPDSLGNLSGLGWDEVLETHGAAVSLAGLGDALWSLTGHDGDPLGRWGDVAWGRSWKRVTSNALYRPAQFLARDEGWYVRVVPLDTRQGAGRANGGSCVELSWGASSQNVEPAPASGTGSGVPRVDRSGGAVRLTWWGPQRAGEPGDAWADVFRGGFSPLLDVTLAYDHERTDPRLVSRRPDPAMAAPWTVDHYGLEATFSRVLTGRFGYVDDRTGEIRKPTWGLGTCLPLRHAGEVRYDFASWPQAYPRRVYRHEVSLRFDPFARRGTPRGQRED